MGKLPPELDETDRTTVEADLVRRAQAHSVEDLRRAAKRAVEVLDTAWADRLETDTLAKEEDRAYRQAEFWMRPTDDDGMVEGGFTLPQLQADILRSALESHTAPRHDCTNQPDESTDLLDQRPTYRHKLGRAFTHIIGHLPTDSFGNHGGIAATLIVTTDYDTLTGAVQRAGTTNLGNRLTPDTIRHTACTAGIIPAILDGKGRILDFGTRKRLFSPAQRISLAHRDGGCAFPHCDRPPGWCEAHHLNPWSTGGTTNLNDGVLLCAHHHRTIHHTPWTVALNHHGQPEFTPPKSIDPHQTPHTNNRWKPATPQPATLPG